MDELVQPNSWVVLKLPSETIRVLQVAPNSTISLGKYGSFPSNLIIHRPYHLTFELLDKREGEDFCRLRIVPAAELYSDLYDEAAPSDNSTPIPETENDTEAPAAEVVDKQIREVAAAVQSSVVAGGDGTSRQTLTMEEIEALRRDGAGAGKELISKLMESHTGLDQKTTWSLAKYKLLKTKKYIRRFSVLPFDVARLDNWMLDDKDPAKILEMREEMIAMVGCWANVHYGGDLPEGYQNKVLDPDTILGRRKREDKYQGGGGSEEDDGGIQDANEEQLTGRWLVVDDTGGLLTAAMAERMGILCEEHKDRGGAHRSMLNVFGQRAREVVAESTDPAITGTTATTTTQPTGDEPQVAAETAIKTKEDETKMDIDTDDTKEVSAARAENGTSTIGRIQEAVVKQRDTASTTMDTTTTQNPTPTTIPTHPPMTRDRPKRVHKSDFEVPIAPTNTVTIIHANTQPNLSFLKYYDFDITNPNPHKSTHPLASRLLNLTWLQLLSPEHDNTYATPPPSVEEKTLLGWKASRRGNYHRKRRRWARTRHTVDSARAGGFSGLAVAATMEPVSVLRHTLPLLAGGSPIAVYSQAIEPLMELADCFSLARRSAWASGAPAGTEGKTAVELERWEGTKEFPLNPSLLLGVTVHTARARRWQVHPGRTHPLMTSRGGAEGYVFTAHRAVPAEGKVAARGKFKRRKVDGGGGEE